MLKNARIRPTIHLLKIDASAPLSKIFVEYSDIFLIKVNMSEKGQISHFKKQEKKNMERTHNDNSGVTNLVENVKKIVVTEEQEIEVVSNTSSTDPTVLFIEPFYGGSHKQLLDLIALNVSHTLVTLTAKKWPWRARCSALIISEHIPPITTETTLFCSSVLSLCELLGLRPDLNKLKKVVYFHENQFIYPVRTIKERDVQFAYNQITTCLAADVIIFNSYYNMESLLNNLKKIIKLLPDYRPKGLKEKIEAKCCVLYFPVSFPKFSTNTRNNECLHIVWPHRWEFDKGPEMFLQALLTLQRNGYDFIVHFLGQNFENVPALFDEMKGELAEKVWTYGYVEDKDKYYQILRDSHVVVSTARHEFFGVAMLEATYCGCYPLLPNELVYPEIYPKECLYNNEIDLIRLLTQFCREPESCTRLRENLNIDFNKYSVETMLPAYINILK